MHRFNDLPIEKRKEIEEYTRKSAEESKKLNYASSFSE